MIFHFAYSSKLQVVSGIAIWPPPLLLERRECIDSTQAAEKMLTAPQTDGKRAKRRLNGERGKSARGNSAREKVDVIGVFIVCDF